MKKRKEMKEAYDLKRKNQAGGEKTSKCKNSNYELNVGFDIITQSYDPKEQKNENTPNLKTIEIYLQMNIIAGKVNEKNMTLLNCPYNDIFLGDMYENLLYNSKEEWNITNKLLFFDGTKILEGKNNQNQNPGNKQKQQNPEPKK